MSVGIRSLDTQLRSLVDGAYPNFGQTFFVVDSDYRTQAQGWSKSDGTGPLDLIEERRPGKGGVNYVYRTGDFATDEACLQAAHDAAVAFRGDAIFLTPGNVTPTAAVNFTTQSLRLVGPPVNNPPNARAILTAGVDAALSIATTADDMELAFLRVVPLTNTVVADVTGTTARGWWHHFWYDANGIATATGTSLLDFLGAATNWRFSDFMVTTDTAQAGPFVLTGNVVGAVWERGYHLHVGGTQAIGLVDANGTGCFGLVIDNCKGYASGGIVTNLATLADQANSTTAHLTVSNFDGMNYATATTLIVGAGATAEVHMLNCRISTVDSAATTTALYIVASLYTG